MEKSNRERSNNFSMNEIRNEFRQIRDEFRNEMSQFRDEIRNEMSQFRDMIREEIRQETRDIRDDLVSIKSDIVSMKNDIVSMKSDIKILKNETNKANSFIKVESLIIEEEITSSVYNYLYNHDLYQHLYIINPSDYNEFSKNMQIMKNINNKSLLEMDGILILTDDPEYYEYFRSKSLKGVNNYTEKQTELTNRVNNRNKKLHEARTIIKPSSKPKKYQYQYYFIIMEAKHKLTIDLVNKKNKKMPNIQQMFEYVREYSTNPDLPQYTGSLAKEFREFVKFYQFEKFSYENILFFFGAPLIMKDAILQINKLNNSHEYNVKQSFTNSKNKNGLHKNIDFRKLRRYNIMTLTGNRYSYYSHHQLRDMM